MMKFELILFSIILATDIVSAILCWTCTNVSSEQECRDNGRAVQCPGKGDACQIEVRYEKGWGIHPKITKRCKQALACENNFKQNLEGLRRSSQCSPEASSPVCRCCCETDRCNFDALICWDEPKHCPSLKNGPRNGKVSCTNGKEVGSRCNFQCNEGFKLKGKKSVTCRPNLKWNSALPECQPITCPGLPATIMYGSVKCSKANHYSSRCTISCEPGYELSGSRVSTCNKIGKWTPTPSVCHSNFCKINHDYIKNGAVTCSKNKQIGSICEFSCDSGYNLAGERFLTCTDAMKWDFPAPKCEAISCSSLSRSFLNGLITCSLGNSYPSKCKFACREGFILSGEENTECTEDGTWSNPVPSCQRDGCDLQLLALTNGLLNCSDSYKAGSSCKIICEEGFTLVGESTLVCNDEFGWDGEPPKCVPTECPHLKINQGSIECSLGNAFTSICRISCDDGFKLLGPSTTTCIRNGKWSAPLPECVVSVTTCPSLEESLENGLVECTVKNQVGSICNFKCVEGYKLDGRNKTMCKSSLEWDDELPLCRDIRCSNIKTDFDKGFVKCTNGNRYSSVCRFYCQPGFKLNGSSEAQCDGSGYWTPSVPICEDAYCPASRKMLVNGKMVCTDDGKLGTKCEYICDKYHDLVGNSTRNCISTSDGKLRWDGDEPHCESKYCPSSRISVANGRVVCTDDAKLGSICEYICEVDYYLVGDATRKCIPNPNGSVDWDKEEPYCEAVQCETQERIPHGIIKCSKENNVTSTCDFKCTTPYYSLYPPDLSTNMCMGDSEWDKPTPCCARPCPPYALMDFVLILDSSSSIGVENWMKMIDFLQDFMDDFLVKYDGTNFGVLRYNRNVDVDQQILLKDHTDDIQPILKKMGDLKYDGSGTLTGKALRYALDVLLTKENGNREHIKDVLLVITDGMSQDPVEEAAQNLRNAGVETFVLPVKPNRGSLNIEQLRHIAGKEENMIMAAAELGFQALTAEFSKDLGVIICGDPCDHAAPETPLDRLVAFDAM
ncbi:sushi, von Willebrand factor type A, EGF and pentraxin domain-containing protein 1-like [Styela clava]